MFLTEYEKKLIKKNENYLLEKYNIDISYDPGKKDPSKIKYLSDYGHICKGYFDSMLYVLTHECNKYYPGLKKENRKLHQTLVKYVYDKICFSCVCLLDDETLKHREKIKFLTLETYLKTESFLTFNSYMKLSRTLGCDPMEFLVPIMMSHYEPLLPMVVTD